MNDNTFIMLNKWLESGTAAQKDHANKRLAMPDAQNYSVKKLEFPSLLQQAKSAVQAVASAAGSLVHGESVSVSEEEQDRRLDICYTCEFWALQQQRCSKCGCFGEWKTWLASQRCPIGKW